MTRPICDKCSVLHTLTGNERFLVSCHEQGQRWASMVDGACAEFAPKQSSAEVALTRLIAAWDTWRETGEAEPSSKLWGAVSASRAALGGGK